MKPRGNPAARVTRRRTCALPGSTSPERPRAPNLPKFLLALVLAVCALPCVQGAHANEPAPPPAPQDIPLKLHVPSPDWRDQIIYFVVTDRFNDGDASNNDQGAGEFDPADPSKYSGGDLRGIEQRLDYIQGLGATALWLTPPVANQWWDTQNRFSGYHGYWARDFMAVDAHLGTLADYQRLSHKLHSAGMYLVQDIVVNHTGNYFSYAGGWERRHPERHVALHQANHGDTAPTQWPFNLNDARDPVQRRMGIYHWTPDVADYTDPHQVLNFQMAGLDDLNTDNPLVRDALRQSYGYWIREVGVDAFRVDTAFYVPASFFSDFLHARHPRFPGIATVARQTGRQHFLAFGEGFAIDKPYSSAQARRIDGYMRDPAGKTLLPGMLNFPLYGTAGDVFARGHATAELAYRIRNMMRTHRHPHLMPSFVDNHDVDRFLASGSREALKQNLLLIMTLPGIPVIYYGTEQGFTEQRGAMFKGGFHSGGQDHFDTQAPLYGYLRDITALRRSNPLFSRGQPTVLRHNQAGPGALAYRMQHGPDAAIVVFNSSDAETLLDNLPTGLPPGTLLRGLFGIQGMPDDLRVGAAGRVHLRLPGRSGWAWRVTRTRQNTPASAPTLRLNPLRQLTAKGDFQVSGAAPGHKSVQLVIDGDLAHARTVTPAPDGHWTATVPTDAMTDPSLVHEVVSWSQTHGTASKPQRFRVVRQWKLLADTSDPADDDHGPTGSYVYPTDSTWSDKRLLDIRGVQAWGSGGALRVDVKMNHLASTWNPPNGFDHVAFNLFIEVPGRPGGASAMPRQNASLPQKMRWHYRVRAHGWSNALFSSDGASATADGTAAAPAAQLSVHRRDKVVRFVLSPASLGGLKSLSGVRLYVNTWDYDGGYRPLAPEAGPSQFGGGNPAVGPLYMDDTTVITLP